VAGWNIRPGARDRHRVGAHACIRRSGRRGRR
jgi:hypothetical protein